MKKLLLVITIFFSFAASAQNYYVYGKDTVTQRPGYLYLQRPLYLLSPLYKANDSAIGVNAAFIGVDSIPTFKYKQTNQTRTVGIGLMDSVITNGIQFSPSLLLQGVDTVLGGLHKKIGFETYLEPILNTTTAYPDFRLRWFADTAVNSSTGVGTGYSAMDLYQGGYKNSSTGASINLDFPNGAILTGFGFSVGNTFGMRFNNGYVDFPMGSSIPLTISSTILGLQSNTQITFSGNTNLHYGGSTSLLSVGVASLDGNSGFFSSQGIALGNASTTYGAGKQFSVYGSQQAYGSAGAAAQAVTAVNNNGTMSFTSGSTAVTGTGTHFLTMFNVNDSLYYFAAGVLTRVKIASITDDTHLTLVANAPTTSTGSGQWYDATLYQQPFFQTYYNGVTNYTTPFATSNLNGFTTTIAAGTGAGTSPTVSITGNDISGYVTITTGTSPTVSGDIVTITFSKQLMNIPTSIQLTAAGENAAVDYAKVYVDQSSVATTSWKIKNISSAALQASTTYKFYYTVTQ